MGGTRRELERFTHNFVHSPRGVLFARSDHYPTDFTERAKHDSPSRLCSVQHAADTGVRCTMNTQGEPTILLDDQPRASPRTRD